MIKEAKGVFEIFNYYWFPFVSAVATVVIAIYAWKSHNLAKQIKRSNDLKIESDEEFRDEVKSLYQAIVIATVMTAQFPYTDFNRNLMAFKAAYKGKFKIFD